MFSVKSNCDLQIVKKIPLKFLKFEIKLIKPSIFVESLKLSVLSKCKVRTVLEVSDIFVVISNILSAI